MAKKLEIIDGPISLWDKEDVEKNKDNIHVFQYIDAIAYFWNDYLSDFKIIKRLKDLLDNNE